MFGPFFESFAWVKARAPYNIFKKRRLNFITIHYFYILSMSVIGSILLFPAGGIAYIDALFFGAGCATQSGLNPVNVNQLGTYQQVVLYFIAMMCNPIFINTFVVFVRLYWFERRFQNVVREVRQLRGSRSRTKTEARNELGTIQTEKGVRGRSIVVMHNGHADKTEVQGNAEALDKVTDTIDHAPFRPRPRSQTFQRNITFADEVQGRDGEDVPPLMPQRLSPEQHIAILENQRNPKDKGALRIPGPRDFDRGIEPEALDVEGDKDDDTHNATSPIDHEDTINGNPVKRNITIDVPDRPPQRTDTGTLPRLPTRKSGFENMAATPTAENPAALRARTGTFSSLKGWTSRENEHITPYLSWQPTIGRNSAFVNLTEEQREELGGIEYRSLKTLAIVLVSYWVSFHLLGVITLLPWIVRSGTWGPIVDSDGLSRVWWGIFTPASMFNDLGFTLTPDSMVSFQLAILPLLLGAFLIIIGNTGFPCMLRFVIWVLANIVPRESGVWEELMFLLDHPRRCFTLLFPTAATWWLFWILVILNGVDIVFFIILDLDDTTVTGIGPPGYRVLNGLFQAASTRTAGFASVNLANLHPGIQVSYLIMMYISVFPIAISVRRTNVYEEKSLGIYGSSFEESEDDKEPSYVGAHLRRQLSFDLWYIFLGMFIIAIAEGSRLADASQYAFSLFAVLFEIVSAYGTVGLSLGYPNVDTSFSAQFSVISKLVIIAMQIRGRHRGLPYELDRAVLLPSDHLHKKEDVDAGLRAHRRNSSLSNIEPVGHILTHRTPTAGQGPVDTATASGNAQADGAGLTIETSDSLNHSGGHLRRGVGKLMAGMAKRPQFKKNKDAIDGIEFQRGVEWRTT